MKLVDKNITIEELEEMTQQTYGELVKAVVDVEKEIMVVDAEFHSDEESFLLENESIQENLWGINLYPQKFSCEGWIEFDSMINMRPSQGNRSRGVEDKNLQKKIINIVNKLVSK